MGILLKVRPPARTYRRHPHVCNPPSPYRSMLWSDGGRLRFGAGTRWRCWWCRTVWFIRSDFRWARDVWGDWLPESLWTSDPVNPVDSTSTVSPKEQLRRDAIRMKSGDVYAFLR